MAEDKSASGKSASAGSSTSGTSHPPHSEDRGTFVPLIFGGAVATALGFFAGQIDSVEARLGLSTDDGLSEIVEAQSTTIAGQAETISGQSAALDALSARLDEVAAIEIPDVDLSEVTDALATQSQDIAALAARIEAVEKRPMTEGLSEEAVAAYQAELTRLQGAVQTQQAELQTVIDDQRAEIEALLAEARSTESSAEEKARLALVRAAMSKIITAVNSGSPFADALAELSAAGGGDVPEALASTADSGVPTLTKLQGEFPKAARAALSVARSDESGGGLGSFLQKQLGARSVTPREGNDPDAVLSRAEAALQDGRVGDALSEVGALSEAAQSAMGDWISMAQTRDAATRAADELMTALATN